MINRIAKYFAENELQVPDLSTEEPLRSFDFRDKEGHWHKMVFEYGQLTQHIMTTDGIYWKHLPIEPGA